MKRLLIIVLWIGCGYFDWGMTIGYCSHAYPYMDHRGFAAFIALTGPFGMAGTLMFSPYHWQVVPYSSERRWQEFHEIHPTLQREYFEREYN